MDASDARCLLGYLERIDSGYELMWMAPVPGRCQRFTSFEEAIRAASWRLSTDDVADRLGTVAETGPGVDENLTTPGPRVR